MKSRKITISALLAAIAILLGYFENMIPSPIPGVKPGTGNIAVLVAMYLIDWKSAAAVSGLKVGICALIFGTPSSFLYSLSGAFLSFITMAFAKRTGIFSEIGVSMTGAIMHNIGQLLCAGIIVGKGALYYIPVLCAAAAAAGFLTGIAGKIVIQRGRNIFGKK